MTRQEYVKQGEAMGIGKRSPAAGALTTREAIVESVTESAEATPRPSAKRVASSRDILADIPDIEDEAIE
jgi:hypothetical protein